MRKRSIAALRVLKLRFLPGIRARRGLTFSRDLLGAVTPRNTLGPATFREARMVSVNEELKAAKAAKAAINALSTATRKSAISATLRTANHAAILNLGSGGALNEARTNVGIALKTN
jgi:hypothetical protein